MTNTRTLGSKSRVDNFEEKNDIMEIGQREVSTNCTTTGSEKKG